MNSPQRTIPRRVNFGYPDDDLAAKLARYGKSVAVIAKCTGLTRCQVQLRYKRAKASPMNWRTGAGQSKSEVLAEIERLETVLQLHSQAMARLPEELKQLPGKAPRRKRS